jgi:hypothetical protein
MSDSTFKDALVDFETDFERAIDDLETAVAGTRRLRLHRRGRYFPQR